MFDNVKQLESEIKEFEQNILASRDLVNNVKGVAEAVSQQTESIEIESKNLRHELQKAPEQIKVLNEAFIQQLTDNNAQLISKTAEQISQYNDVLRTSTEEVKQYHSYLTDGYAWLINETRKETKRTLDAATEAFVKESEAAKASYSEESEKVERVFKDSLEEIRKYQSTLDEQYQFLMKEIGSTQSKLEELKKAYDSKFMIIMVLVTVSIVVGIIGIIK